MQITKPIIVFGTGRSGTTIFHKMLSKHPDLTWLSGLCDLYPNHPYLNKLAVHMTDSPVMGHILQNTIIPGERYLFWENYCKGFSTPFRDLVSNDLTVKNKNQITKVMSSMLSKKKNRLLLKITGWPRLGFLSRLFEDAKFIHVIRDGRSVANSLINVDFWWGWRGPENWRWGELNPIHQKEWEKFNRSFIVLAAIQWKILMDAYEMTKHCVKKSNLLEIKYENLCTDHLSIFKEVTDFCELKWDDRFIKALNKHPLRNTNSKWQNELNENQKTELNEVLKDHLRKYHYS